MSECKVCGSRESLKKCGNCMEVYYCSLEHQKKDWKDHKLTCLKKSEELKTVTPVEKDEKEEKYTLGELFVGHYENRPESSKHYFLNFSIYLFKEGYSVFNGKKDEKADENSKQTFTLSKSQRIGQQSQTKEIKGTWKVDTTKEMLTLQEAYSGKTKIILYLENGGKLKEFSFVKKKSLFRIEVETNIPLLESFTLKGTPSYMKSVPYPMKERDFNYKIVYDEAISSLKNYTATYDAYGVIIKDGEPTILDIPLYFFKNNNIWMAIETITAVIDAWIEMGQRMDDSFSDYRGCLEELLSQSLDFIKELKKTEKSIPKQVKDNFNDYLEEYFEEDPDEEEDEIPEHILELRNLLK